MPKSVKRHWINYQIPRYLMSLGELHKKETLKRDISL